MGVSYLHPIFFGEFSGACNLQNAIDFAELRSEGVAGFAPKPNI